MEKKTTKNQENQDPTKRESLDTPCLANKSTKTLVNRLIDVLQHHLNRWSQKFNFVEKKNEGKFFKKFKP